MSEPSNAGNNADDSVGSTGGARMRIPLRRRGLSARAQRFVIMSGFGVVGLLALAWTWSIAQATASPDRAEPPPSATSTVRAALTSADAPTAAYVTDAALEALASRARGSSGKLRVKTVLP